MKVAVIIVNYRTTPLVEAALASIASGYRGNRELRAVVVDGFSNDGSLPELQSTVQQEEYRDWVRLLPLPINGGFGWANNQAILRLLQGPQAPEFIHLLNPDAKLLPDGGTALLERMYSDHRIGAVGSQLLEPGGGCVASAFHFPTAFAEFGRGAATGALNRLFGFKNASLLPSQEAVEVDWVTGASVLFRAEALKQVGLFDDAFFLYHEEVELMWRLHSNGWTVWHEPRSLVVHVGGVATGIRDVGEAKMLPRRPAYWYQSRQRMFKRMYGVLAGCMASIAWTVGHGIWLTRRLLGIRGGHVPVKGELQDTLRCFVREMRDRPGLPTKWTDEPGKLPRWRASLK